MQVSLVSVYLQAVPHPCPLASAVRTERNLANDWSGGWQRAGFTLVKTVVGVVGARDPIRQIWLSEVK